MPKPQQIHSKLSSRFGLSTDQAERLRRKFGSNALNILLSHPFDHRLMLFSYGAPIMGNYENLMRSVRNPKVARKEAKQTINELSEASRTGVVELRDGKKVILTEKQRAHFHSLASLLMRVMQNERTAERLVAASKAFGELETTKKKDIPLKLGMICKRRPGLHW